MKYCNSKEPTGGNIIATPEHKKSRPLYIAKYIRAKSDVDLWVSQKEILDYLYEKFDIMPDRKSIKRDIAMLRDEMGMDIEESHIAVIVFFPGV